MIALALPLLLASLASCQDPPPATCKDHEFFEEGCAPLPYICQISCDETDGCKRYNTDETEGNEAEDSCKLAKVEESFTYEAMDSETCSTQCDHSKTDLDPLKRCRFWRSDIFVSSKLCTLMSEEQCMDWDECIHHEVEGQEDQGCTMGDNGCPPDADGSTQKPEPALSNCKGPIVFGRNNHIHWTCRTSTGDHLSAYSPQEVIPDGALCTTNHKCFDWGEDPGEPTLTNKLQVKCDNGMWKADEGTAGTADQYKPILNNEEGDAEGPAATAEAIQEPTCTGGGAQLTIPKANIAGAEGAELICEVPVLPDVPDAELYTINAPNSCILLCDYQLGWTIDSYLNDDGVEVFKDDKDMDFPDREGVDHVQNGDEVKCWPV